MQHCAAQRPDPEFMISKKIMYARMQAFCQDVSSLLHPISLSVHTCDSDSTPCTPDYIHLARHRIAEPHYLPRLAGIGQQFEEEFLPGMWRNPPEEAKRAGHGGGDWNHSPQGRLCFSRLEIDGVISSASQRFTLSSLK